MIRNIFMAVAVFFVAMSAQVQGFARDGQLMRLGQVTIINRTDIRCLQGAEPFHGCWTDRKDSTKLQPCVGDTYSAEECGAQIPLYASGKATIWNKPPYGANQIALYATLGSSMSTINTEVVPNATYYIIQSFCLKNDPHLCLFSLVSQLPQHVA